MEINLILDELKDKKKRAREIKRLLAEDTEDTNASGRWKIVRSEIEGVIKEYGRTPLAKRRTIINTVEEEEEYTAEDFIVAEDCHVLITKDGWVKRQKQIADPAKSRLRQGDSVLACVAGNTRATIGFFSSMGFCYTARMIDIPASTGFGEPIQKLFKMKDGERIVAAISFDDRGRSAIFTKIPSIPITVPKFMGLPHRATDLPCDLAWSRSPNPPPAAVAVMPASPAATGSSVLSRSMAAEIILAISAELPRDRLPGRRNQLPLRGRQRCDVDPVGKRRRVARIQSQQGRS